MPTVAYPLDATGIAVSNLIPDEVHLLTEVNSTTYRILIPVFAPFYLDNLALNHVSLLGEITPLIADVDYYPCLPYIGATRSVGKMLYGGLTINTELPNGVIKVTYQTLGGDWTADASLVLNTLAEIAYNPRTTIWDIVTNKPNQFPPINHDQRLDYVYGEQELIDSIDALAVAIAKAPNPDVGIIQHLTATGNVHELTLADLGLENAVTIPIASDEEITDRVSVEKLVTLRQLLEYPLPAAIDWQPLTDHVSNNDNPHGVTKDQVHLGNVANLPVATDEEVANSVPAGKYVTLKQVLDIIESHRQPIPETEQLNAATYYLMQTHF